MQVALSASVAHDVYYNDVEDSTKLKLTTWRYLPTVYIGVQCGTAETVCVVLDKEDALDLARRINEAFGDGDA